MKRKERLREKYLDMRKNIDVSKVKEASTQIIDYFLELPEFNKTKNILCYISYRNEVNTYPLIKKLAKDEKKEVFAPYCIKEEKRLEIALVRDLDKDVAPGAYGIPEPRKELRGYHSIDQVDLVVVPAVAFSRNGFRVGYGGGYYDRFLDRLNDDVITVGFTYDKLLFDTVPKDEHDRSVDIVITDTEIIYCNK